ncbi:MAG: aminoglycoside phosphotransferase family protein [Rickettsiales bacterium]|jgi:aminoglycoside phosphotransferase (APT) family kinase protein|nr:aminoglycoside phosphotransferase family protein [Rickettsiales bacterium]
MDLIKIIQSKFKYLQIREYDIIDSGLDNTVIMVNNSLAFRFPKKEVFYKREKDFLDVIYPHITINIPYINIYEQSGHIFTLHKSISGKIYASLPKKKQEEMIENISEDLAIFMAELHSIKSDLKPQEEHNGRSIKNKEIIINFLKEKEKIKKFEEILRLNEKYSNKYKDKDLVICHNDLHGGNFLVNPKTRRLSGIIDFGDVSIRNYTTEFYMLFESGENIAMKTLKKYEKLTNRKVDLDWIRVLQKYRAYRKIGTCLENNKKINKIFIDKINL